MNYKWLIISVFALAGAMSLRAQDPVRNPPVRNPHGPIAIACQNCHTTTSWSPLRAAPEFNHTTGTHYPLRGMHVSVACSSCHVSKVFTAAGTQCADCHADFHRRQFGAQCEQCHTVQGWRVNARATQSHWNRFPLFGAHAAVSCESCHKGGASGTFTGLSTDCASCHIKDYNQTTALNHRAAGLSTDCRTCHVADSWQNARFDHNRLTKFVLAGAHVNLACTSCHVGGKFQGTPADCFSCHAADFARTTNPNHVAAGFPRDCSLCHTSITWQGAKFDHTALTRFPLTGKHVAVTCTQCHAGGVFKGTPTACSGCHLKDYDRTVNPNHRQANFPQQCEACHTTAAWQGAKFDHNLSKFPLTGKHTSVACASCHVNNVFTGLGTECVTCHLKDWQATKNPAHQTAGFSQNCQSCHTTTQWLGAKFDHNATKFPLTGKHTAVTCASCHVNNQFAGLATACSSCHIKDYQAAKSINHVASGFPQTCELCHNTTQWQGAKFDHNTTKFPLTGKHTSTTCASCHVNNVYAGLGTECVTCHLKDWQATKNPVHASAGFSQNCQACHITTQWLGAKFDHSATKFPLTGKHTSVACASCHVNNQFAGLATACSLCHIKDYQAAKSVNHVASGFPQTCELCHTTAQWQGAKFDHNTTKFPLTGKHTSVACASCHVNNVFKGLPAACESCHLKDFQATKNPNHVTAGFSQNCALCHTTAQWQGAKFDHSTQTKYPLTGKHSTVACASCHVNNIYKGTPTVCENCHIKDYRATKNPNHAAAGYPQTCVLCHTTAGWTPASFNHNTTKFPLTGKHTGVACASCHVNNVFAGLGTACVNCHLPVFQKTTNPNHVVAGFPQDCSLCHSTTGWTPASFNHSTTKFPLTGKHTTVACATCHVNSKFAGLGTACVNCHLANYTNSKAPAHAAAGYPADCALCHSTAAWTPSSFNHANTGFTLTGKHTTTLCSACHVGGKFAGTPTDCYSCHTKEYASATNPNHVAAGFPKTCATCHSTATWLGATFNHTYFPMTHGQANSVCTTCHINSNDYKIFTCTNCHLKPTTDSHHQGVRNYVYNSINCYQCHPQGRVN